MVTSLYSNYICFVTVLPVKGVKGSASLFSIYKNPVTGDLFLARPDPPPLNDFRKVIYARHRVEFQI